jgi:hypothetical protein
MNKIKYVFFLSLSIFLFSPKIYAISPADIEIYTIFPSFYTKEPVTFGVHNVTDSEICFPNSAPWRVLNIFGLPVYQPTAVQVLTCLEAGGKKEWQWRQTDNAGDQVDPGYYYLEVQTDFVVNPRIALSIDNITGSDGHFTFGIGSDTLRVFMSDPHEVREAIETYHGIGGGSGAFIGSLLDDRPSVSRYDSQWSWHLDPASIRMLTNEVAIELCDGTPSMVEGDLDYWMSIEQYCPWSAQIISLE